jgi:putative ABC transport system permease protein
VADGVVVSEALARRYFPGESALGKQLRRLESDGTPVELFDPVTKAFRSPPAWNIVGVVGNVREGTLRGEPAAIVYVPVRDPAVERSIVPIDMSLVIRTEAAPAAFISSARAAIRELDPTLSVGRIRTMDAILASSIDRERMLAALLLSAAAVSVFLGAIGVYGVAAHTVRRREQEIGIRLSLGARPGQLVVMVIRQAGMFIVGGTVVGLATTLTTTRALQSFLFEVSATDPVTVASVTALLMAVAMTAVVVPARRAVRLDRIVALRSE